MGGTRVTCEGISCTSSPSFYSKQTSAAATAGKGLGTGDPDPTGMTACVASSCKPSSQGWGLSSGQQTTEMVISVSSRPASAEGDAVCPADLPLEGFSWEKSTTAILEVLLRELK